MIPCFCPKTSFAFIARCMGELAINKRPNKKNKKKNLPDYRHLKCIVFLIHFVLQVWLLSKPTDTLVNLSSTSELFRHGAAPASSLTIIVNVGSITPRGSSPRDTSSESGNPGHSFDRSQTLRMPGRFAERQPFDVELHDVRQASLCIAKVHLPSSTIRTF